MAENTTHASDIVACRTIRVGGTDVAQGSALNEYIFAVRMWGVASAGEAYLIAPVAGEVIDARIQLDGQLSGNDPQFNLRDAQEAGVGQLVVDVSEQSPGDTFAWTLPAEGVLTGHGTPLSVSWNGNTTGNVDGTIWIRVRYEEPQDFYFMGLTNSNGRDGLEGYKALGGLYHMPILSIFNNGGGLVADWGRAESNKYDIYRTCFRYAIRRYGRPDVLWWNIYCDDDDGRTDGSVRQVDIDDMESVIAFFEEVSPGMTIYVSGPNDYDGITCSSVGTWGNIAANAMVEWLISEKGYHRGPVVPALNSGNVAGDNCHPSPTGHTEQGEQLRRFFDGRGVINGRL